jgi:hypothetical protein
MFDSKLLLVNHKGKKNKGETYEQHEWGLKAKVEEFSEAFEAY